MYNFKFAKAEQQFRWIKQKYEWHPLPYFLLGLSQWWKIVPNIDNKEYDEKFIHYMDTSIMMAERMYNKNKDDPEAAFFLAAGYAFKGRLYAERRDWSKATFTGKNALKYLEICKNKEDFSPELLFGDALYNYYAEWVPENYPILKPLLMFFPPGDKEQGMEQLRTVATNAFYTRTEAQYFLMRILYEENEDRNEALHISEYLAITFPDNAYFQRYYARMLYGRGRYNEAEKVSLNLLNKIDQELLGYEATSGRYAAFFLAQINEARGDKDSARYYYEKAVHYGIKINATESGYFLYSLLNLGEIVEEQKQYDLAETYYKMVKDYASRKDDVHKRAQENLKRLRRKK
jgi:tetratricopeptide (TPR) repeat protein